MKKLVKFYSKLTEYIWIFFEAFWNAMKANVILTIVFMSLTMFIAGTYGTAINNQRETIDQQRQQIDNLLLRNAEQQIETEEQRTKANALQDEIWNYREHMQREENNVRY